MRKGDYKYIGVLALLLAAVIGVELAGPKPIDWTQSFDGDDRRPYGSLVLRALLPELFPEQRIEAAELPPYLVLRDTTLRDRNYLFLAFTFAPDEAEMEVLLDFVARGNAIFAAARNFHGPLADTLNLDTNIHWDALRTPTDVALPDTITVNFANEALRRAGGYAYRPEATAAYFGRFDTLRTSVLGENSKGEANFIRMDVGGGAFYLSSVPLAFTNYNLLDESGAEYVAKALSYLPVQDVLWDDYYKPLNALATTPLRYVLVNEPLRHAYFVLIGALLLFLVFEGKRRQRVIPVARPPRNDTVAFVRTVGRLYYSRGDHAGLARKKIAYFLDHVRTRLRLDTNELGEETQRQAAERSGVPLGDVRKTFALVERLREKPRVSEAELGQLSRRLEAFYQKGQKGRGEE